MSDSLNTYTPPTNTSVLQPAVVSDRGRGGAAGFSPPRRAPRPGPPASKNRPCPPLRQPRGSFSSGPRGAPGGCPQVGSLTPSVRAGPPLYAVWRLTSSGRARPPFVSPFSSVLVSRFLPRAAALVCAVPSDLSSTDKFDLRGLVKYRVSLCVGFQSYINGIGSHVPPTRLRAPPPGASGAQGIASGGGRSSGGQGPAPSPSPGGRSQGPPGSPCPHCTERPVATPSS